jgi:hypothetical protein
MKSLRFIASALVVAACVGGSPVYAAGDLSAWGGFSCDFGLSGDLPLNQVPPALERDRMYMAARPGMVRKDVPISIDPSSPNPAKPNLFGGGRYLFTNLLDAVKYKQFVDQQFVLDGVHFLQRPYFINPDCHVWITIGARDFAAVPSEHVVVRTERFAVPPGNHLPLLVSKWPQLSQLAASQGLTSVYLWYNPLERLVSVVSFDGRVGLPDPTSPDVASLLALQNSPAVGQAVFGGQSWTPKMDRTQWVLTYWYPFLRGDQGTPSVWPNSPPFPMPYAGDGVCEVSRGENAQNSAGDCLPTCWNGVPNLGETSLNCPGDVRLFPGDAPGA